MKTPAHSKNNKKSKLPHRKSLIAKNKETKNQDDLSAKVQPSFSMTEK
jgi:hypothetical protein